MKSRVIAFAASLGLLSAGVAAAETARVAPLALPMVEFAADPPVVMAGAVSGSEWAQAPGDRSEVRYRPRRRGRPVYREPSYGPRPETFTQFHLGFMDVDGPEKPGVLFGLRGGLAVDPHVQVGGQIEWRHRGNSDTQVISSQPAPGGGTITVRRDLARSSSDLIPLMALVQIGGGPELQVIPYFGIAGGVEILHLSAENFETGEEFDGTFSGFGWQMWGGVAFPLSGRSRVNAELFYNGAELSRDIEDDFTGQTFRETVDMNGAGGRIGLAWGF